MTKYRNPKIPDVRAGGVAIPLGNNFFYMKGRKHSTGGIDVGDDLEVEDGEVMQLDNDGSGARVYSSVPFLRGNSPAQLVLGGANPNAVFRAQENFKDRNRIKDDGTKYDNGGVIQRNDSTINNRNNNDDNDWINSSNRIRRINTKDISPELRHVTKEYVDGRKAKMVQINSNVVTNSNRFRNIADSILDTRFVNDLYGAFYTAIKNKNPFELARYTRNRERNTNLIIDDLINDNTFNMYYDNNYYDRDWLDKSVDFINNVTNAKDKIIDINKKNKKQFGGNMPSFSINGNIKDGLIFVPSSTGRKTDRHKAPLGSRVLGLDRTMRMLQQSGAIQTEHTPVKKSDEKDSNSDNNAAKIDESAVNTTIGIGLPLVIGGSALATYLAQNPKARKAFVAKADAIKQNVSRQFGNLAESFRGNEFGVIDKKELKRYTDKRQPDRRRTKVDYEMYQNRLDFDERGTGNMYGDTEAGNIRARQRMNGNFIRGGAPTSEIESNRFNRQYDRVTGKREPASGFGRRPVTTEVYMSNPPSLNLDESTNIAGQQYDATVEARRSATEFADAERQQVAQQEGARRTTYRNNRGTKPRIRTLANRLGIIGNLNIIGDLIRSLFANEEDDRQQRKALYEITGDVRFLNDLSDIYPEPKERMKYGGRKKAELGTENDDKNTILGVPLFSLFGPKHDRVLQIDYDNNGGVKFYNGIWGDLNNPEATFLDNLNNSYYMKPIDWFHNRRYEVTPTSYTPQSVETPATPATPAPRRGNSQGRRPVTTRPVLPTYNPYKPDYGDKLMALEELKGTASITPTPDSTPITTTNQNNNNEKDDGRYRGLYNAITPNDWWSLGANIAGSFGSWLAGLNSPRMRVTLPDRPILESPVRMRTSYNNRPEVSRITEETRRAMRDVRANTASSRAALQRLQRLHNARVQGINESEANKYNIETQLRNADAANRQGVRTRNVNAMNRYLTNRAETINRQNFADYQYRLDRVNRNIGLLNNVNVSFQDFLDRINRRENYNNTLGYLFASHPNVDDRAFRDALVRYAELVKVNG